MKAIALIEGAAYGPDALKTMTQAFDKAWACVAHHFENGDDAVRAHSDEVGRGFRAKAATHSN